MTGKLDAKKSPRVGAVSDARLPQQEWLNGLKQKFPVSRFIRVSIGLAILLIGAWFFLPGLLFPISSNAVVNAHVITLRAPIAGDVSFMFSGTDRPIAKGDIVTRLENNRVDDSQLSAMQAQQATLQEKIGAIEQELLELEQLEHRLKTSSTKYRRAVGSRYDAILAEGIARLSARRAIAGEAAKNLQRQRALYAKRLTTLAALDTAEKTDRVAQADLHEAEQAVERIHIEKQRLPKAFTSAMATTTCPTRNSASMTFSCAHRRYAVNCAMHAYAGKKANAKSPSNRQDSAASLARNCRRQPPAACGCNLHVTANTSPRACRCCKFDTSRLFSWSAWTNAISTISPLATLPRLI